MERLKHVSEVVPIRNIKAALSNIDNPYIMVVLICPRMMPLADAVHVTK
jgi:hypothetical protein